MYSRRNEKKEHFGARKQNMREMMLNIKVLSVETRNIRRGRQAELDILGKKFDKSLNPINVLLSTPRVRRRNKQHFLKTILMFLFWQTSNKIYFKLVIIKSKQSIDQSNSLFSSGTFEVHHSPLIIHYMVNIED